jgi:nucleotide-binding universal stress UspA family protein
LNPQRLQREEYIMALRALLVPIHKDGMPVAVLDTAAAFAKRYGCYMEGIALNLTPPEFIPFDLHGAAWAPANSNVTAHDAEASRHSFNSFMQAQSIAGSGGKPDSASQSWCDKNVADFGGIAAYARVFDMTVFGRCSPTGFCPHRLMLEATLFESGRPILIAPPTAPKAIGDNIVIAWNCSTESARTVGFAMPLLNDATRVTVLTVEGGTVPGPSGADLVKQLRANGIGATERTVPAGDRATGVAILSEAAALGCDLLIKGAYTQSRLRQMIFGGATSHILGAAEVPVLMAN